MTNKEKFIEVMNQTFNAGLFEGNIDTDYCSCPPVFAFKVNCGKSTPCSECRNWWNEEYKEVTNNA